MTDHDLSDLLDRLGDRAPVGPPPTAAMLAAATRGRRRRTTWLAVGTAAAVTVGGLSLLRDSSDPANLGPADPSPTSVVTPAGTRLVGLGHAAIAVPEEWGTNRVRCAAPQKDTVIIDQGAVCLADFPRPEGVESVSVHPRWYGGFGRPNEVETQSFDLDGEPAERVATACVDGDGPAVCTGAVYLPGQEVSFVADSSSRDARARVEEILSWIRVVPDRVGVPGFQDVNHNWYHEDITAGEHYRTALEILGLQVEVVAESRQGVSEEEGYILGVEPQPGTMVAPGSVVLVIEIPAPD